MDRITGNFLTQDNKDFPLDCETLDALQANAHLAAMTGNIAGDKTILAGCEETEEGVTRKEGYVFLRTRDFPQGEVLRFEGGPVEAGMYLKKEDVAVECQGYGYPKAYVKRTLAPGAGEEAYSWADFHAPQTPAELYKAIEALKKSLEEEAARFAPPPLGIIQMWAGSKEPDGYALCDGRQLSQDEYPELYKALGSTFNNAPSASGSNYVTTAGHFRLPDLRGRFVAGYHDSDTDYNAKGRAGGEKTHRLTADEGPAHTHAFKNYFFSEQQEKDDGGGRYHREKHGEDKWIGCNDTDWDNTFLYYVDSVTETAGAGSAHENRPPYYTLAYIMRLR